MTSVSLNADVEDGLEGDFIPLEDTAQPNPESTPKDVTKDDVSLTENEPVLLPAQLPDFNSHIEQVDERRQRIADLQAVRSMITNQSAISQESASLIDSTFNDFIGSQVSLKEFTMTPSRVNFDASLKFMNTRIAKEEVEVVGKVNDFFTVPLAELRTFVTNMKEYYVPKITDEHVTLRSWHAQVIQTFAESKNSVLPMTDGSFVNIATTPIRDLNAAALQLKHSEVKENTVTENFSRAVEGLKTLLDTPALGYFIQLTAEGRDCLSNETWRGGKLLAADGASFLSLNDLVLLFKSEMLVGNVANLAQEAQEICEYFDSLSTTFNTTAGNYNAIDTFIVMNIRFVVEHSNRAHLLNKTAQDMLLFNKAMHHVMVYLKYCL